MSMIYLPDTTAKRLKDTATRQRRGVGATVEILLDLEDQRVLVAEEKRKEKEK